MKGVIGLQNYLEVRQELKELPCDCVPKCGVLHVAKLGPLRYYMKGIRITERVYQQEVDECLKTP